MAYAIVMAVLESVDKLFEVKARLALRQLSLISDLIKQFTAAHELQHDKDLRGCGEHILDAHHVVMIDHLHDGDLLLDLRAHVARLDLILVQYLDGHRFVRLSVHCIFYPIVGMKSVNKDAVTPVATEKTKSPVDDSTYFPKAPSPDM